MNNARFLSVRDVAEKLNLSQRSVYALINRGKLPHHRLGTRTIRISAADLDEYIESCRIEKGEEAAKPPRLQLKHLRV